MKLLIIGDLHGIKPRIHFKNFDAIVVVGDVASDKEFRPLVKKWLRHLKDTGNAISDDWFIEKTIGKREMRAMEKRSLEAGNKILKYLDKFGKPIFMVPGNWDQSYGETKINDLDSSTYNYLKAHYDFWLGEEINKKLTKGVWNLKNCQYKLHEFEGVNFVGYGNSSAFESVNLRKKVKKEVTVKQLDILKRYEKKLDEKLALAYKKRNNKLPTIFITHNVPYGTTLDLVTNKDLGIKNKHLGSTVARKFVTKFHPMLCVGGHIHEYFKKTKLGKTVCINSGFGKDAQVLVELDTEKKKIKKIEFWKGEK